MYEKFNSWWSTFEYLSIKDKVLGGFQECRNQHQSFRVELEDKGQLFLWAQGEIISQSSADSINWSLKVPKFLYLWNRRICPFVWFLSLELLDQSVQCACSDWNKRDWEWLGSRVSFRSVATKSARKKVKFKWR